MISLALHALLFWLAGLLMFETESARIPNLKPIHIRLAPATPAKTESNQASVQPKQKSQRLPETSKRRTTRNTDSRTTDNTTSANTSRVPNKLPSASTILDSARDLARTIARRDKDATKPTTKRDGSTLEYALNAKREAPGVKTLADGTIRVVTDYGLVYCVRPGEDWRFPGPGEQLPLNMTCR